MKKTTSGTLEWRVLILAALVSLFSSCASDADAPEVAGEVTDGVCKVSLNVRVGAYQGDDTRAASYEWQDGDRIYLALSNSEAEVSGYIRYDADEDGEWSFHNEGVFPAGDYVGKAVFLNGEATSSKGVLALSPETAIYEDLEVECEKTAKYMRVVANLRPKTGRLRLKGSAGLEFAMSGVVHNEVMNLSDLTFETSEKSIRTKIGDDGYSPYMYCSFPETSNELTVTYDDQRYKANFKDIDILAKGLSGYMDMPTKASHSGWDMTELSTPQLGAVEISSVGTSTVTLASKVVSNGNGVVTDCGFCYAYSKEPTVNNVKVSFGKPNGESFSMKLTGLIENTTYHVRAYAMNESGIEYSEDYEFTTLAIVAPTVSVATVNVADGSTEAEFRARLESEGNGEVTECGFVYSTSEWPTIDDKKAVCKDVAETFTAKVSGLKVGTKYYVRAYAKNEKGIGYGDQMSFIGGGGKPSDDDLTRPNN